MVNKPENLKIFKPQRKIKKPKPVKLVLLNDNFTTMEFVVRILKMFLNKTHNEAVELMLKVHNTGSAVCGVFPGDIAKTIQEKIYNYSRINKQPLKCIIKK